MKKPTTRKSGARKPAGEKAPTQSKAQKAAAKTATRVEAAKAAVGSNSVDPKVRELFQHHLTKVRALKRRLASVNGDLRNALKVAKGDGFLKPQFDLAIMVQEADGTENVEGVEKLRERMRRDQAALLYIGSSMGTQFTLDLQTQAAPSEDESIKVAAEAGKRASQQNNKADPRDYAPNSGPYEAYMAAFHDNEATKLKGMKSTNGGGVPADAPASGQPMTRAQFRAQQEALKASGSDTAH